MFKAYYNNFPHPLLFFDKHKVVIYGNQKIYQLLKSDPISGIKLDAVLGEMSNDIPNEDVLVRLKPRHLANRYFHLNTWGIEHENETFTALSFREKETKVSIRETLNDYFLNTREPILLIDRHYMVYLCNKRWTETFGQKENETVGCTLNDLFSDKHFQELKSLIDNTFETHRKQRIQKFFYRSTELEEHYFEVSGKVLETYGNETLVLSFKNVSNTIKLKSFRNILKKTLETIDTPVLIFNKEGDIYFYNKAFRGVTEEHFKLKDENAWEVIEILFEIYMHNILHDIETKRYFSYELPTLDHIKSYFSYTVYIKHQFFGDDFFILSLKKKVYGLKNTNVTFKVHKTVYDAMDDIVFVLDTTFKIKSLNAKGVRFFELSRNDLNATSFINLAAIKDKGILMENLVHVLEGHSITFDIRMVDLKEGYRWFSLKCSAIYENGQINEIIGIARDISKEKEIAHQLKLHSENLESMIKLRTYELTMSRRQYQTLINGAADMIFMVNRDLKVTMINDAGCLFVGIPLKEIKGKHIMDVFPEGFNEELKEAIFTAYSTKQPYKGEHEITFQADKLFLHTNISVVKDRNGHIAEFVGISRDITHMKDLQKRLDIQRETAIQAAKLAAIGEMATGIAHEINQPLNHLKLAISMNEMELEKESHDIEKVRSLNHLCLSDIERATKIIQHLRSFGRKESEELSEPVNTHELIEKSMFLFNEMLNKHHIEFITELQAENPYFLGGYNRFEQVILNLMSNAKDALLNETVRKITYRTYNSTGSLVIEVEDNGVGVPEEHIDNIFNPFFTTKEVGKGTGIGLSISYGIINSFRGTISVENRSDKGCIFRIELPSYKGELV